MMLISGEFALSMTLINLDFVNQTDQFLFLKDFASCELTLALYL